MKPLLEHTRRPDITFCRNGRIFITAPVAKAIGLHPGDSINIYAADGEYVLAAVPKSQVTARSHARCSPTKKGSRNYYAYSVYLARTFLDAVGARTDKAAFFTGEIIDNSILIITRNYITL